MNMPNVLIKSHMKYQIIIPNDNITTIPLSVNPDFLLKRGWV